jgi:phosphoribosyl 1,2-cyclic phosphodiesterase
MLIDSAEIFRGLQDEKLCNCLCLYRGSGFETTVKGLRVIAFPTPHDSLGAVGYRFEFVGESGEIVSLGVSTDTGYVTETMRKNLNGCHAVVIESNHDAEMLACGPYPYELKQRIRSRWGHLSNTESAELASELYEGGTKHIMLAHLSEENNLPSLAFNEVFSAIADEELDLKVAKQDEPVWLIGGQS